MTNRIALWLAENGFGKIVRQESVGGGCINDSRRLHLDASKSLFLKQHTQAPGGMFRSEAVGLEALGRNQVLRVPNVLHVEEDFILLEDIGQSSPGAQFWTDLGEGLAQLHSEKYPQFGFSINNYCGLTPQQNDPAGDGHEFFANLRILKLASQAFDQNQLDREELAKLEYIAANLARWIPKQPAVLIHGDLWSGNIHCDEEGHPALIDPATYWGWAEAELAMTGLFGGFDSDFYRSYGEQANLDTSWRERAPLYNLYHLLNHLLLFGGSYLGSIKTITHRFAGK